MNVTTPRADLEQRIEAVETGYEFMLAYAAQGRDSDKGAAAGRNVREFLERMAWALEGLGAAVVVCAESANPELVQGGAAFFAAVDNDARVALAAVRGGWAGAEISWQLGDDLYGSMD
jgi:hypothetical protein